MLCSLSNSYSFGSSSSPILCMILLISVRMLRLLSCCFICSPAFNDIRPAGRLLFGCAARNRIARGYEFAIVERSIFIMQPVC